MQHTFDIVQVVATLAAFIALASRLFVASRPFWSRFPAWAQTLLPVLVPTLTATAQGLSGVRSWSDLSVLFVVSAGMLLPGLPSNRSAAPLQAGKDPKLTPSAGDVAVAEAIVAKASARPPERMFPSSIPPALALLLVVCAFHAQACSSTKPPCDQAKLAGIVASCVVQSQQCVNQGKSEAECETLADCDAAIGKACGQ
jgi:hypothetical protein